MAALLRRRISFECTNEFPKALFLRRNIAARHTAAKAIPHSAMRAAGEVITSGELVREMEEASTGFLIVGAFCADDDCVSEGAMTGGVADGFAEGTGATGV